MWNNNSRWWKQTILAALQECKKETKLNILYHLLELSCKVKKNTAPEPWVWSYTRWDEILKEPAKKYTRIQRGMKLRKPSILVVNWDASDLPFFWSASTAATYIFIAPNCTTTIIISLEPCALNAEYEHFILSCNVSYWDLLKYLYFANTTEKRG